MHIIGIDEIDNKLLNLLIENARYSYSQLGEQVGLSRVAVKNRIEAMEELGLIQGYTVKLAPRKVDLSVEFILTVAPKPEHYEYIMNLLGQNPYITRLSAATGKCKLIANGMAPNSKELDAFYNKIRGVLKDVLYFNFEIIASIYKDVDGGIEYEQGRKEIGISNAGGIDS